MLSIELFALKANLKLIDMATNEYGIEIASSKKIEGENDTFSALKAIRVSLFRVTHVDMM